MLIQDPKHWAARFRNMHVTAPSTARAFLLVRPVGFRVSAQTASDNRYMQVQRTADPERALAQHAVLAAAIARRTGRETVVFDGAVHTPDAVFPNNVFATVPGKLIVGAMRHPERQREGEHAGILQWFAARGYGVQRLAASEELVAELTGPLIIDRARGAGFYGLTERCTPAGAQAMQQAFGLELGLVFPLVPGEYHTNVVMSVLAGRFLVLHTPSIADPETAKALVAAYAPNVIELDDEEKAAFCGNCIALTEDTVWMSARAERALAHAHRRQLREAGFEIHAVEIDEIEKAGGSLRCCVAEVF